MAKWNIGIGMTSSCNMKCQFCYSKIRRDSKLDIPKEYWYNFIDENHEQISTINYGTGENALSKDWFEFVSHIRVNYPKIRQALTTNGYVFEAINNNEHFEKIFLDSIDEVDVSLDFCDKQEHNKFRGQEKAYHWATSMMAYCQNHNKSLTIVCLGSHANISLDNIEGLFELSKKFDAVLRVNMFRPTAGINEDSKKFILSTEEVLQLLKYANDNHKVLSLNDPVFSSLLIGKTKEDPSGINSLRILPNGDVSPSTYLITSDFIIGNIKNGVSLEELKDNEKLKNTIKDVIPEECMNCEFKDSCKGGVIDRRYIWNGTLCKKDPYCYKGNEDLISKYNFNIVTSNDSFNSVHDGYLPTMFFKY